MYEGIKFVFQKEVLDNLRDRRSLISGLITTLITPALLITMILVMGKTVMASPAETTLQLPIVGAERAPSLILFLQQNGVEVLPGPQNPVADVRSGKADLVLVVTAAYPTSFTASQPATLQLIMDTTRQSAVVPIRRATQLLSMYNSQVSALRLVARGVSPSILVPLWVEDLDVSTPQSQVTIFLNMLPFLLLVTIFSGGMYVIIDTTAGERERSSLEPLLINPIPRWQVVIGKYLATLPFVLLALVLALTAFAIGFNVIPIEQFIGTKISLSLSTLWAIFLICLPVIFFATSLQMIIATFTHSYKEAQTYVGLMAILPALPGVFLALLPTRPDLWKMMIPTFGQQILINQVLRGEAVSFLFLAVSETVTILAAGLLILVAIRLYQREQILFGSK